MNVDIFLFQLQVYQHHLVRIELVGDEQLLYKSLHIRPLKCECLSMPGREVYITRGRMRVWDPSTLAFCTVQLGPSHNGKL